MSKAAIRAEEEELAKKRGDINRKFPDEDLKCKKNKRKYWFIIFSGSFCIDIL